MSNAENILIDYGREQDFCIENGLSLQRLPNRSTVLAVNQFVEGSNTAAVEFTFPSGSVNNPPGKSGFHHFFEHMVSTSVHPFARKLFTYYNASTSALDIDFKIEGTANPKVKDYGIWTVFPYMFDALAMSGHWESGLSGRIEEQKGVVLREIEEGKNDLSKKKSRFLGDVMYGPLSPMQVDGLGLADDVLSITEGDIRSYGPRILTADGLTATIFNQGRPDSLYHVQDDVLSSVSKLNFDYPSTGNDYRGYSLMNENFRPGSIFEKDLGYRDGITVLSYVWIFGEVPFSHSALALDLFMSEANNMFFDYARSSGLSYSAKALQIPSLDFFTPNRIGVCELKVGKRSNVTQFATDLSSQIKDETFSKLTDDVLEHAVELKNKDLKANEKSPAAKMEIYANCLKQSGRLVDLPEIEKRQLEFSVEHMIDWRERFLASDPTVIISGDISDD